METTFTETSDTTMGYIRKVYGTLSVMTLLSCLTAYLAVTVGTPEAIKIKQATLMVAPAVAFVYNHPLLTILTYFGFAFGAIFFREKTPSLAVVGYPAFVGLFLGPTLAFAEYKASGGHTLSAAPIRDAAVMTLATFGGLTGYTLFTRKNFSFLFPFLFVGIITLLVAMILVGLFGSALSQVVVSGAAVLLFMGFILYDTSEILHGPQNDAVGDALNLYLDLINMFVNLLRILGYGSDDKLKAERPGFLERSPAFGLFRVRLT